jgi:hypothetical protein
MMEGTIVKPNVHTFKRIFRLAITLTIVVLLGCGSGGNFADNEAADRSASISFQFNFDRFSHHAAKLPVSHAIGEPDICNDYLIEKVEVQVFRTQDDSGVASAQADCARRSLTITNVPAAQPLYLVCKGYVGGNSVWQGRMDDVVAVAGQNTDIGAIDMTYSGADGDAPEVVSTFPPSDAANVDLNASIVVIFSEKLASGSISDRAITVSLDDIPVPGEVDYNSTFNTIRFLPLHSFEPEKSYTATLQSRSGSGVPITDTAGHCLSNDVSWNFTTRGPDDNAAPQVIATSPPNGATDVGLQTPVSVLFSEPMNPDSLTNGVFQLSSDQGAISGQIAYDAQTRTLSLTSDSALKAATVHTALISNQGRDLEQNSILGPYAWQFLTAGHIISTSVVSGNGDGGSISPDNPIVWRGDDITINIKVHPYFHLSELIVDGVPVMPTSSYLFENVNGHHKIEAIIESNAKHISEQWFLQHDPPNIDTNGNVVWHGCDTTQEECDIFYYDGSTTKNITEENGLNGVHRSPQINAHGDVVWYGREDENSGFAIYYYDRLTASITLVSGDLDGNTNELNWFPQISDSGDVVWFGGDNSTSSFVIYQYDRSTELKTSISEGSAGSHYYPQINAGGDVVWYGCPNTGECDIFYYDGSTTKNITEEEGLNGVHQNPRISANGGVVWPGRSAGDEDSDIFYYDGSTTKNITAENELGGVHRSPQISADGHVVWQGESGTTAGVYYYNNENETNPVTQISEGLPGANAGPDINANGEVVWLNTQGVYYYDGATRIKIYNLSPGSCQINDQGYVVWSEADGSDGAIYLSFP